MKQSTQKGQVHSLKHSSYMSIKLNQFSVMHAQSFFSLCTCYGIENTKKSPLFILFFIYNTDHIEFITFNNIWHILYILFAYFKTLKKISKSYAALLAVLFGSNDKCTFFFCPLFMF